MRKLRVATAAVLAVLVIVLILQNTAEVETRLLFMTVTMPRAVLLLVTLLVGFALGMLACLLAGRGKAARPEAG